MNIDITKIQAILIYDENGKLIDRFLPEKMSLVKDKVTGNRLEFQKAPQPGTCPHLLSKKTLS